MTKVPLPGAAANTSDGHSAGSHGAASEEPTDRVSEVIWSGNSLPDEYFESFGLSLRLPVMKDGEKLYFTVSQRSASLGGAWMNWSYVPGVANSGPEGNPAPFVTFQSVSKPVNGSSAADNATAKATSGTFSSFAKSTGWMVVAAALLL
jgi:uncharacterized protein YcnI